MVHVSGTGISGNCVGIFELVAVIFGFYTVPRRVLTGHHAWPGEYMRAYVHICATTN